MHMANMHETMASIDSMPSMWTSLGNVSHVSLKKSSNALLHQCDFNKWGSLKSCQFSLREKEEPEFSSCIQQDGTVHLDVMQQLQETDMKARSVTLTNVLQQNRTTLSRKLPASKRNRSASRWAKDENAPIS